MRSLPPWRLSPGGGVIWLFAALLFLYVWVFELEIWLTVWCCYGIFLAGRWMWRHNPIGQTIDTMFAARERHASYPDVSTTQIDLSKLDR